MIVTNIKSKKQGHTFEYCGKRAIANGSAIKNDVRTTQAWKGMLYLAMCFLYQDFLFILQKYIFSNKKKLQKILNINFYKYKTLK